MLQPFSLLYQHHLLFFLSAKKRFFFFCFGQESRWARWLTMAMAMRRVRVGGGVSSRCVALCLARRLSRAGRRGRRDRDGTGRDEPRSRRCLLLRCQQTRPPSLHTDNHPSLNRSHPFQHAARGCHDRVRTHAERTQRTTGRERRNRNRRSFRLAHRDFFCRRSAHVWVCGTCAMHGVRVCACVISVDNSEFTRNGDYAPTRFAAQNEAAGYLANAKLQVRTRQMPDTHRDRDHLPATLIGSKLRCRSVTDAHVHALASACAAISVCRRIRRAASV